MTYIIQIRGTGIRKFYSHNNSKMNEWHSIKSQQVFIIKPSQVSSNPPLKQPVESNPIPNLDLVKVMQYNQGIVWLMRMHGTYLG